MSSPIPSPSGDPKKPLIPKRIAWGAGGLADNFILSLVGQLILPIYNVGLGVSAVWLGLALGFPRVIDAILDPLMGVVSDNTRSKWGRRRPYIVIGAIVCALMCFVIWLPSPHWSKEGILTYFIIAIMLYSVSYTVFVIPYTALGFELTSNYDERTRALAWRMYFGLAGGFAIPWLYKLCLLPVFGGNELVGVKWVAGAVAIVIVIMGVTPGLFCRENEVAQHQATMGLGSSLLQTVRNRPFVVLMIGYTVFFTSLSLAGPAAFYVNLYYVYGGDKGATATLGGWTQSAYMVGAILALPVAGYVGGRLGKRFAITLYSSVALLAYGSFWFTFSKTHPYTQIGTQFFIGFGLQGFWLLISSMIADICDEDECVTGLRREGAFGAVYSFINKASVGFATLFTGILLSVAGYSEKAVPTPQTLENLKILFVLIQVAGISLALLIVSRFPITRERAMETQALLRARRGPAEETAAATP
jgi:GPH family glycoside/pentoside/hexuronide:cation symporter